MQLLGIKVRLGHCATRREVLCLITGRVLGKNFSSDLSLLCQHSVALGGVHPASNRNEYDGGFLGRGEVRPATIANTSALLLAPNFKVRIEFKVCKSVHHCTTQINHQPDATIFQFIILTFIYRSTCFGCFPAHHQELNDCSGSLWFYLRIVVIVVLCSWSGRL